MNIVSLSRKAIRGLPYLAKEIRAQVSDHTPFFIARPRVVHLWRRAGCNARCIMCDFGYRTGESLHALSESPLKDESIAKLLRQTGKLGGRGTMISYMGGEPLLNRHIMGWLDLARELGLDFRFTTNGYLVDEDVARRLAAANLFNIGVSLESLDPAINELLRPRRNGTQETTRAIELLIQERRRQATLMSINIKCTITQPSIDSVIPILERWGKIDGVIVTPQAFEILDGMPDEIIDRLWISDIARLEATMNKLKQMRRDGYNLNADDRALDSFVRLYREDPRGESTFCHRTVLDSNGAACNIGSDNLFIANGEVLLCPYFPPIGDVLTETATLEEMWFSDKAKAVREQIKRCRMLCTISCLRRTPLRHKIKTFLKM